MRAWHNKRYNLYHFKAVNNYLLLEGYVIVKDHKDIPKALALRMRDDHEIWQKEHKVGAYASGHSTSEADFNSIRKGYEDPKEWQLQSFKLMAVYKHDQSLKKNPLSTLYLPNLVESNDPLFSDGVHNNDLEDDSTEEDENIDRKPFMATLRITEEVIAIPGVLPALEKYFDSVDEITTKLDGLGNTRMYIVQKDGLPDDRTAEE